MQRRRRCASIVPKAGVQASTAPAPAKCDASVVFGYRQRDRQLAAPTGPGTRKSVVHAGAACTAELPGGRKPRHQVEAEIATSFLRNRGQPDRAIAKSLIPHSAYLWAATPKGLRS